MITRRVIKRLKNPCRNCNKISDIHGGHCNNCRRLARYESFLKQERMRNKKRRGNYRPVLVSKKTKRYFIKRSDAT